MSQDVFSQLSRQISEAQHRGHLETASRHMARAAKNSHITDAEFNRLSVEWSKRRDEIAEEATNRG